MSDPEESDNRRTGRKSQPPTASFDALMEPRGQIDQFRIERELGRGAMGVVYLACDGTTIFYRDGASVVAVPVDTKDDCESGRAKRFFDDVYLSATYSHDCDIHPSGKQFLMIKKSPENTSPTEVIIVENWFEQLKRLTPPEQN
jgi:hypothetical protein